MHVKTQNRNTLGQPIGFELPDWSARSTPDRTPMSGTFCDLVPLQPKVHAQDLFDVFSEDSDGRNSTYLRHDPFTDFPAFKRWLAEDCCSADPLFFAVIDKVDGKAVGMASLLRVDRFNGVIEVGHIHFSDRLQNTPAATEAMFLMMHRVFEELGYRRYEWKCDNCNEPSKQAAVRLGFTFEGVFRQAIVYKGRNRDTAWFSILDAEWPRLKKAFKAWLDPGNFDTEGMQIRRLQDCVE